jgi:hypothetical protein
MTSWLPVEVLKDLLYEGFISKYCESEFKEWSLLGVGGRYDSIWTGVDGLVVMSYAKSDYCGVQVKGSLCERVGMEGVVAVHRTLQESLCRQQVTRLDVALDGVPFGVADVIEAVESGGLASRYFAAGSLTRYQNGAGATVYLGREKSGKVGECDMSGDMLIRVYDRRKETGTRFEIQVRGDYSKMVGAYLDGRQCSDWPDVLLTFLAKVVRFHDGSNVQVCRCNDVAWWRATVGVRDTGAMRLSRAVRSQGGHETAICALDKILAKFSKRWAAAEEAGLMEWLGARLQYHAACCRGKADPVEVERLCKDRLGNYEGLSVEPPF